MRVMCIDDKPLPGSLRGGWHIKFGEIYNVVGHKQHKGLHYYELDIELGYGYLCKHFAPLSEINETELVNKKQDVCV